MRPTSLELVIIDGIKVSFEPDENGFWNGDVHHSVSHDIILLNQWIVREAVDLKKAIDLASAIVPLKLLGYDVIHCDPEGRVQAMKRTELSEENKKADPQLARQYTQRFSLQDDETKAQIQELIAKAESLHDWSKAKHLRGYSEKEVLAMLRSGN